MHQGSTSSTEQIAIWMLEALEKEYEREPDISKCRFDSIVFGEVMAKHHLENEDINRGLRFIMSFRGIRAVNEEGGRQRRTLPTPNGLQYLEDYRLRQRQENTLQKRQVQEHKQHSIIFLTFIITVILTVLTAILAWPVIRSWFCH